MNPADIGQEAIRQFVLAGLSEQLASLIVLAILITIEICLAIASARFLKATCQEALRLSFRNHYHILLNRGVTIKPIASTCGQSAVTFRVPYWLFSNKDGSRDKRRSNNRLIRKPSVLQVSHYSISSKQPYLIYWLYKELLLRNVAVAAPLVACNGSTFPVTENRASLANSSRPTTNAIQDIYEHYKSHPTDFEEYCADLFRRQGYKAATTPKTNDGGFDIKMVDPSGGICIVECKCYNPRTESIGRDTLQKLVGANACMQASRMIFITTSHFTSNAIEYARAIPESMELIDGGKLEQLIRTASQTRNVQDGARQEPSTNLNQVIDWEEIARHFPPDV